MVIRKATINDAEWILNIRNTPDIFKYFKNNTFLSLEKHINWLKNYLSNNKNIFLISEEENWIISWYIRKDYIKDSEFEISIAININFQKKWIAWKLLKELLLLSNNWDIIYAEVNNNNIASFNFFQKNWFLLIKNSNNHFLFSLLKN